MQKEPDYVHWKGISPQTGGLPEPKGIPQIRARESQLPETSQAGRRSEASGTTEWRRKVSQKHTWFLWRAGPRAGCNAHLAELQPTRGGGGGEGRPGLQTQESPAPALCEFGARGQHLPMKPPPWFLGWTCRDVLSPALSSDPPSPHPPAMSLLPTHPPARLF